MKRTNIIKKYAVLFLLFFMISLPVYCANPVTTVFASEIQPMSDDIRWVIKKMNGKYYKRLYNFTNQTWIGDWILIPS